MAASKISNWGEGANLNQGLISTKPRGNNDFALMGSTSLLMKTCESRFKRPSISRGVCEVFLSILGRGYLSEVVSEFEPKTISTPIKTSSPEAQFPPVDTWVWRKVIFKASTARRTS